jgi:tryptophan synthase alpha chain
LAVGFGISNRDHVEEVGKSADAAVVGSALVRVMLESPREELIERASRFVAGLAGRSS